MLTAIDIFFKNNIFIHTHIEKCGGSTLVHYLNELFGKDHVCDIRPYPALAAQTLIRQYPEIKQGLPNIRVLSGHTGYREHWEKHIFSEQKFIPWLSKTKKPLYIASIRHPIDRLISLFRYIRLRPNHPGYLPHAESLRNNDFDAYVQSLIKSKSCKVKNEICIFIKEKRMSFSLLEEAKKSFEHNYFIITPHNKTHELANLISETFSLPCVEEKTINGNESKEKITPSEKTINLLKKAHHDDILLYEYILSRYPEKLQQAKQKLQELYAASFPRSL